MDIPMIMIGLTVNINRKIGRPRPSTCIIETIEIIYTIHKIDKINKINKIDKIDKIDKITDDRSGIHPGSCYKDHWQTHSC